MADTYKVRSNRESGYGRYDVMIEPFDRSGKAFIFAFKVLDPDEDEVTLEDTLANLFFLLFFASFSYKIKLYH